jgi:hypothetical protein
MTAIKIVDRGEGRAWTKAVGKLATCAATALAVAVPGLAHAGTLPSGYDPYYSNHVEAGFDGTTYGEKFDFTATGGLAVIGNPDPNPAPSTFWAAATNNNYAIPSLYASVRATGYVSGLADSYLEYAVEFAGPGGGHVGITVQASAQATAAADGVPVLDNNPIASALLQIIGPGSNRLVDISARSDLISALGTKTTLFDQLVTFQDNVIYYVVMEASAQAAYDHSAVAAVDPYFDLSNLPDGVTILISNGIGNELPNATPIPAALPLFASGLGALGLLGWRRKKKAAALAA